MTEEVEREVNEMSNLGEGLVRNALEQGIEQGIEYNLLYIMMKKVRKGKGIEQIAEEMEYELEEIYDLYEVLRECGADSDIEQVMEILEKKRQAIS